MSELTRLWVDGALVDPAGAGVSALDHGLVVGDAVFEATKIVGGRAFALTRHFQRMARSVAGVGLSPVDVDLFRAGIEAVLGAGPPIALGKLRWWVTGGVGSLGTERTRTSGAYLVAAEPISPPPASGKINVVPWTRNERGATAGLKTTSYAENVIALAAARRVGAFEAVFGNTKGELCEGTGTNVFVVVDGTIITPPAQAGPLLGVTRGLLIEWCLGAGMRMREKRLPLDVLQTAEEVFLTSSTKDVFAVDAVDERLLVPGPVTAAAAEVFRTHAAADFDP